MRALARAAGSPFVVAVHGITANAWSWGNVAHHLNGEVGLVAIDLRGRGASQRGAATVRHARPRRRRRRRDRPTRHRSGGDHGPLDGRPRGPDVRRASSRPRSPAWCSSTEDRRSTATTSCRAMPCSTRCSGRRSSDCARCGPIGSHTTRCGARIRPSPGASRSRWSATSCPISSTARAASAATSARRRCASTGASCSPTTRCAACSRGTPAGSPWSGPRRACWRLLRRSCRSASSPSIPRHDWRFVEGSNHYSIMFGESGAAEIADALRQAVAAIALMRSTAQTARS